MESAALEPTARTAHKPIRIPWPSGVKSRLLEFTSGGRTGMPISRHSLMYFTTLSVLPISDVSSAERNSSG